VSDRAAGTAILTQSPRSSGRRAARVCNQSWPAPYLWTRGLCPSHGGRAICGTNKACGRPTPRTRTSCTGSRCGSFAARGRRRTSLCGRGGRRIAMTPGSAACVRGCLRSPEMCRGRRAGPGRRGAAHREPGPAGRGAAAAVSDGTSHLMVAEFGKRFLPALDGHRSTTCTG
jgi:hypothetical protein